MDLRKIPSDGVPISQTAVVGSSLGTPGQTKVMQMYSNDCTVRMLLFGCSIDATQQQMALKRPAFLSSFSRSQVIQNKRPWCWAATFVTAGFFSIESVLKYGFYKLYFFSELTFDQLNISKPFLSSLLGGFAVAFVILH